MRGDIRVLGLHEEEQARSPEGRSSKNRDTCPSSRIPGHRGDNGVWGRRSYYSHVQDGDREKQSERRAPPFPASSCYGGALLTPPASLFPVAQRTNGSVPFRAKMLWQRPASASTRVCNGGALSSSTPASNSGALLITSGP